MEAMKLQGIVDGLPVAHPLRDDTAIFTSLEGISTRYKVVNIHETPVPFDFLSSFPLLSTKTEDSPSRVNV